MISTPDQGFDGLIWNCNGNDQQLHRTISPQYGITYLHFNMLKVAESSKSFQADCPSVFASKGEGEAMVEQ